MAVESARGSLGSAAAAITWATGTTVDKRQVEELAWRAAVDVDAFYAAHRPGPRPDDQLLVLTFDGKGIVMRPEALRPATARAAGRSARCKLATRLSPGRSTAASRWPSWRPSTTRSPPPAGPATSSGSPGRTGTPAGGPAAEGKWLTASVTQDIAAVIATGLDEEAITTEAKRRHVTVHIICDFIHVPHDQLTSKSRTRI